MDTSTFGITLHDALRTILHKSWVDLLVILLALVTPFDSGDNGMLNAVVRVLIISVAVMIVTHQHDIEINSKYGSQIKKTTEGFNRKYSLDVDLSGGRRGK